MPSSDSLYFLEDSGKISSNMSSAVNCVLGGCDNTTGGNVTMAPQPCNNTGNESCYPPNSFGMSWYILAIYYTAFISMVIVGAGGNIIVIWIVLAHKRMRTVTNYFLVNLAVADALISILNTLFNFIYMLYMDWPFGRSYCKVVHFISPFTICASVFTFMAIAVDRYIAIVHPLKPRMKAGTVLSVIAVIWILSALLAFPNLIYAQTAPTGGRIVCYMEWPDGPQGTTDFVYSILLMVMNYFLPLLALTITYTKVGRLLWGSQSIGERTQRQEETIRSKRKVVKMMIVVVVIFAVCWLPQHVYFLVSNQHADVTYLPYIQHVYMIIYWLAMSNSMYNPIIYCWMNAKFRRGFQYVFRFLPAVKWSGSGGDVTAAGTVRISMSETTKYERNGSMMHTMMDSLDETSYAPPSANLATAMYPTQRAHFTPMAKRDQRRGEQHL